MNETNCDKASREHTIIMVLGITALALLMLVSIAGAAQSTNVWFHKGSELMSSEKYNEAIKAYDKAIEINPLNWNAWYAKGIALEKLGKSNEATKAYKKAVELNPKLLNYGQ
jgi:superkiller protein 3